MELVAEEPELQETEQRLCQAHQEYSTEAEARYWGSSVEVSASQPEEEEP